MATRRCSTCALDWPDTPMSSYQECPQCGDRTAYFSEPKHMGREEASRLLRRIEFDRFYEKRGEQPITHPDVKPPDWERLDRYVDEVDALRAIPVLPEDDA